MTKSIPTIVGVFLLIAVSTLAMTQYGIIGTKNKTINLQKTELEETKQNLFEEKETRLIAEENVTILQEKNFELNDLVDELTGEVKSLKRKVKRQKKKIASLQKELKAKKQAYVALDNKYQKMLTQGNTNETAIQALKEEKKIIREQMQQVEVQKEKEQQVRIETEEELMQKRIEAAHQKNIANIIDNTLVQFKTITTHKDQFGRTISKIKSGKNKWYYTQFQFEFIHDQMDLLLDENFVLKIIDKDNHNVLSYVEANPNFPESNVDKKGFEFKFTGQNVDLTYYNNQEKIGENYEVQIYYKDQNGREHLLRNSTKLFVQNRKVIKR